MGAGSFSLQLGRTIRITPVAKVIGVFLCPYHATIARLSDCYGILCGALCLYFSVERFKVW